MFYEIVVAPGYTEKGLEILRAKSKTLRIFEAKKNSKGKLSLKQVGGGWLAQNSDDLTPEEIKYDVVTKKSPEESELDDAKFAWLYVKHVMSNAIVIAKVNLVSVTNGVVCSCLMENVLVYTPHNERVYCTTKRLFGLNRNSSLQIKEGESITYKSYHKTRHGIDLQSGEELFFALNNSL